MLPPFLITFDIETIPDESLIVQVLGEEADTFEDVLEKRRQKYKKETVEDVFFPPVFHEVVCISYLIRLTNKDGTVSRFFSAFSPALGEQNIISRFWKTLGKLIAICEEYKANLSSDDWSGFTSIITYNGRVFDIPVLIARTLKHKDVILQQKVGDKDVELGLTVFLDDTDRFEKEKASYLSRYSKYHIDLIDLLGGRSKHTLQALCSLCNIPVKNQGKATEVTKFYKAGEFEKIARYCAEDVKATYMLFLHYLLLKAGIKEMEAIQAEMDAVKTLPLKIIEKA